MIVTRKEIISVHYSLLAAAGGVLLALQWGVQRRWGITIGVPQALAGAVVVLAGLPEFLRPFPFPVPLSVTIGLLLPDLLVRRGCDAGL